MSRQDPRNKRRRIYQQYTQMTKLGTSIEILDDGVSKFDRVIGKMGDIAEGDRVCLTKNKSCVGTVKWIGRYNLDHHTEVDEDYYIVGVKLESTKHAYSHRCCYGDMDEEHLIQSSQKDILFRYFPEWMPIREQPPASQVSAGGAPNAKKSKDLAEKAEYTCNGHIRQSALSKFDRIDLEVNGFHVGSRVKLDTGSVGTVRWIGCYHKNVVKFKDYIVGVELDSTAKEYSSLLTNGWYEGERLVESTKNNIKFIKLKKLSKETEEVKSSSTGAAAKGTWKTVMGMNDNTLELYNDEKSTFEKIRYGIAGIQNGDSVYLCSDKTRTGIVKWIGCYHGQSSTTDPKDFLAGVEMDKPEKECPKMLTDGMYNKKRLVNSRTKNILFTTLKFCTVEQYSSTTPGKVNDEKIEPKEQWSDIYTLDGIPVELYHDGKSAFERAPSGIAGIQDGNRVQLYSEKSRTGTVKWIGCYRGHGYETNSKDFLVGVEVDKPENEDPGKLTVGRYSKERLVLSQKNNVLFLKLKHCGLVQQADTKPKFNKVDQVSTFSTLEEIPIENTHDGKSEVVSVRCGCRVQLYSDKTRIGTVRWLGCHQTAKTDQKDVVVGVQMDEPDFEPEDTLTDGTFCGEQLVTSEFKNVVFAKLQYCEWVDQSDTKPESTKLTQRKLKEHWSTVQTRDGIPIEIYHDGKSAFDRVRYGIAGIQDGDRVLLCSNKTRTGIVKWIGCDHGKASEKDPKDFVVGVEMDMPEKEQRGVLTDGTYCKERLVISQKRNVMFAKLNYCTLLADFAGIPDDTKTQLQAKQSTVPISQDGKPAFDKVLYGIAGIHYEDKVYLYSDQTRTGVVKWIGCIHGQASKIDPKDFLVGVEMDKPENERPDVLTDGTCDLVCLVNSQRRNVMFIRLKHCSLCELPRKPEMADDTKTQTKEEPSTVYTSDGIPIEIYHDGTSKYDRVRYGIAGIQDGDKVQLRSDKTRTGTVRWLGCDHGFAMHKDPKDYLVGVEVDKPEKERGPLTDGNYYGEQLVTSAKRNVRFTKLKCWALVEPERKSESSTDAKTKYNDTVKRETIPNGYTVELYHDGKSDFDRALSGVADFRQEDKVHLYLDKSITGTVKWLGCYHGTASETDHNDFLVGVQVDKIEWQDPDNLTDGTYFGEQLVTSQKMNVVFTKLHFWSLVGHSDMKPVTSNITQRPNDRPARQADSNLSEVKNIPDRSTCEHGSALNKSRKETAFIESNRTENQSSNMSAARGHAATEYKQQGAMGSASSLGFDTGNTANVQSSRRYHFAGDDVTTDYLSITEPESMREGSLSVYNRQNSFEPRKVLHRQNSRTNTVSVNTLNSLNNEDRISSLNEISASNETVSSDELSPTTRRRPKPVPRHPIVQGSPTQPLNTDDVHRLKVFSEGIENAFIENKPTKSLSYVKHKVGAEMMQKMASGNIPTRENARASTTTHETVRYATPQPTTAPVPVSSKSTDDYLPMDTEHFAEHDYSWTRDQFDAGFLLRGTATQQGDKTYRTVIVALKPSEKDLADESGEPLEDVVNEVVLPPTHPEQYNDFWKGVQGDLNSCYMDASMFAMFSYLTVFDDILYGKGATTDHSKGEDVKQTENIRQVLRTQIVNPLRKYGLAQKKGMHVLRNLLDELGLVKGLTGDEKDPEEFLNLLLVNTFATPSPIVLNNGQESHLFHLLAEKEEGMDFPTVQELVERTCLQENFKFSKIPPYLILHLPRFGKDFKMYEKIMPSLELDVTDVISGTSQSCYICEAVATHECYGCYKDCYNISGSCFCNDCVVDYHRAPTRRDHKPQKLVVAEKDDGLATAKCVLKLAAVLCIETSHYVTFVASDTTAAARWYFFDSMADREGTTNIPQVREVPEFRTHLSEAKKSVDGVPPLIRRLVKDGYICFYTNPDVPQYYALGTPLNVTMPGGTTNL